VTCCGAFSKGGCGEVLVGEMEEEGKQECGRERGGTSGAGWVQGRRGSGGGDRRCGVFGVFRAAAQGLSRGIRLHS